eukprot:5142794-Prymnesium_polylepis.1
MVCDSRVCPMPQAKQTEHRTTSHHAPRVSHRHIVSRPARIGAPRTRRPHRACVRTFTHSACGGRGEVC